MGQVSTTTTDHQRWWWEWEWWWCVHIGTAYSNLLSSHTNKLFCLSLPESFAASSSPPPLNLTLLIVPLIVILSAISILIICQSPTWAPQTSNRAGAGAGGGGWKGQMRFSNPRSWRRVQWFIRRPPTEQQLSYFKRKFSRNSVLSEGQVSYYSSSSASSFSCWILVHAYATLPGKAKWSGPLQRRWEENEFVFHSGTC